MRRCSVHYYVAFLVALQQGWWTHVYSLEQSPLVHCIGEPSSSSLNNLRYGKATASKSAGPAVLKKMLEPRLLSRHVYAKNMPPANQAADLVFFAVNSARGNSILRDVIRRTWGSVATRLGMQIKFFVGRSDDMLGIEIEKAKHGDVVVLDVDESNFRGGYNLLSKKTMLLMQWLDKHLKKTTEFAVKVDDDVYFDVEAFVARVYKLKSEKMSTAGASEMLYYGYINERSHPIKSETSKWYDPEFRSELYPPYAAGIFYMLSRPCIEFIAANAGVFKQWRNEDASVGTWLYGTRVIRVHDGAVYPSRSYRSSTHTPVALHMAMSTNVKTSERKLRVKNKDFDAMFTASLMNAAHRHLQEYGTIIGVCEDSANTIDLKVESANVVYMTVDEWVLGRM